MTTADRTWNEFNADFTFPPSEDAARIASEVKASVETWVRNSLLELQQQTKQRTEAQMASLDIQIAKTKADLMGVNEKIAKAQECLKNLDLPPVVVEKLNAAMQAARDAMQQAVNDWEDKGKQVGKGIAQIAETFAKAGA
jgi:hypothetical protein